MNLISKINKARKVFFLLNLLLLSMLLSGCAEYMDNLSIPNPFEKKEAKSVDAVYYGHFSDIPIPVDMEKDVNNTKVVFYNDNVSGIEIYEGRVEINSLSAAMEHNLLKNKWTLIAKELDEKIMQVYQKDNRFAIITLYNQTLTTGMDVWVLDKLPQNMNYKTKKVTPKKPVTKAPLQQKDEAVETIDTTIGNTYEQGKTAVTDGYDNTVKPTVDAMKQQVVDTYNTVENSVSNTTQSTGITIDTTKKEIKEGYVEAKEEVKEASSDIIL